MSLFPKKVECSFKDRNCRVADTVVISLSALAHACVQSSSLKVVRQTYLSSDDAARAPIAVFDLEMS